MIWVLVIFGFVLRLVFLNQSFWLDEAICALTVRDLTVNQIIGQFSPGDFHPPGHYLLLHFWGKLFGWSEVSLRLPSVLFGVGTVWIVYRIGRQFTSEVKSADTSELVFPLVAALLIAVNPFHIYYSQEARPYAMAAFLAALSICFFLKLFFYGYSECRPLRSRPKNPVGEGQRSKVRDPSPPLADQDDEGKEKNTLLSCLQNFFPNYQLLITNYFISTFLLLYTNYYGFFVLLAQNLVVFYLYRFRVHARNDKERGVILNLPARLHMKFAAWIQNLYRFRVNARNDKEKVRNDKGKIASFNLKKWLLIQLVLVVFYLPWLPTFYNQLQVGARATRLLPQWGRLVNLSFWKAMPLTLVKFTLGRITMFNKKLYALVILGLFFLYGWVFGPLISNVIPDLIRNLYKKYICMNSRFRPVRRGLSGNDREGGVIQRSDPCGRGRRIPYLTMDGIFYQVSNGTWLRIVRQLSNRPQDDELGRNDGKKTKADYRCLVPIFFWLFISLLSAWLLSLFIPNYQPFRLLLVLPAFCLLLAWAVSNRNISTIRIVEIFLILVINLVSLGVYYFNPYFHREDWRGVVRFVKSQENAVAVLPSKTSTAPWQYYSESQKNLVTVSSGARQVNQLDINNLTINQFDNKSIYYIRYLVPVFDPEEKIANWLKDQGFNKVKEVSFNQIPVWEYATYQSD